MLDRTKVVYITPAGKELLEELLQRKIQRIAQIARSAESFDARCAGKAFGMTVTDPLTDEIDQLRVDAERLRIEISHAVVVPNTTQKSVVEIGSGIWLGFKHKVEKKSRDARRAFIVVGHGEGDCHSNPPRVQYDSELIKPFMGASRGFSEIGRLDGKLRTLHLTSIFIP